VYARDSLSFAVTIRTCATRCRCNVSAPRLARVVRDAILFRERAFLERGVVGHKDWGEMVPSLTPHAPPTPGERVGLFVWKRDRKRDPRQRYNQRFLVGAYDESTQLYTMVSDREFSYADDPRWTEAEILAVDSWEVPLHDDRGRCHSFKDAIMRGHEACIRSFGQLWFDVTKKNKKNKKEQYIKRTKYDVYTLKCVVRMCASYGRLDLMRCLVVDFHWKMNADALFMASFRGQLQCLKFALENRCPMRGDRDDYPRCDFLDDQDTYYKALFEAEERYDGCREPHLGVGVHQRCREFVTTLQSVDGFLRRRAVVLLNSTRLFFAKRFEIVVSHFLRHHRGPSP